MSKIFVVYFSRTGNTERMAEAVAEGAKRIHEAEVVLRKAQDTSVDELVDADALAFGSPTYFGHMAGLLHYLLEEVYLSRDKFAGKPFAAFASGGGGGIEALRSIEEVCQAIALKGCTRGVASTGAPDAHTLDSCRKIGESLAKAARK